MSKKQIIKKINKEKTKAEVKEQKDTYFKFVTTLTILLLVFVLSYFLLGLFYTKEIDLKGEKETKEDITVDNTTIMLGQLFDQPKDEYYVLVYDLSDTKSSIPSWKSIYTRKDGALSIYTVDSSKKFNSNYIVKKDSNKDAKTIDELKVVSPTFIKVQNKTITEYIEGEENIINKFKE